jgi:hypothetical protein
VTINEYFKTYYGIVSKGNLDELDSFFHSSSPFLVGVKQQYEAIRKQIEMTINLESIELVSKLDDLLVIRDKILFEGGTDNDIKRSISENLHIMVKENDTWKVQSTTNLSVNPV